MLLVRGIWGYKSQWGFPRGKVDTEKDSVVCAVRGVREEFGYDSSSRIDFADFVQDAEGDPIQNIFIILGGSCVEISARICKYCGQHFIGSYHLLDCIFLNHVPLKDCEADLRDLNDDFQDLL